MLYLCIDHCHWVHWTAVWLQLHVSLVHVSTCSFVVSQASDLALLVWYVALEALTYINTCFYTLHEHFFSSNQNRVFALFAYPRYFRTWEQEKSKLTKRHGGIKSIFAILSLVYCSVNHLLGGKYFIFKLELELPVVYNSLKLPGNDYLENIKY